MSVLISFLFLQEACSGAPYKRPAEEPLPRFPKAARGEKGVAKPLQLGPEANSEDDDGDRDPKKVFFPDLSTASVQLVGGTDALQWAQKMVSKGREEGLEVKKHFHGFNVCTEFSGSGCAEAAMMSAMRNAGVDMTCDFQYAADIDPTCRRVLSESCAKLSSRWTIWQNLF